MKIFLITLVVAGYFAALAFFNRAKSSEVVDIYESQFSSEAVGSAPYGSIQSLKNKFNAEVSAKFSTANLLTSAKLTSLVKQYNEIESSKVSDKEDAMDRFISLLPENYRRHFSLVHRSFSVQKGTPQSPRVIMYGPDAKVMMTFNAGHDVDGKAMPGGSSIEVIEWNSERVAWDFSELQFDENKKITHDRNPAKCIMCHAGTTKPIDFKNVDIYKNYLKPIFPQYPFWPGFYGSVNDIVGIDKPGSKDTIMKNLDDTLAQIKGLTFSDTEELFRLRKLLDENPKYIDSVKNELAVHSKYFDAFINGMPNRNRYRQLITLKQLYTKNGEVVPELLKSAPYRRTFDKEYGHYLLRPNFYLSSLMAFYHAQYVASQIKKTPVFNDIKYSLLARKYNCGPLQVDGLSLKDLDPSFDLLYPNLESQETLDRQYLLAYQYNVVAAQKGGLPQLPLHAWNLEGNEDIASYHYGNVFADLNEIVLWNLATSLFPTIKPTNGRSAAEDRHYNLEPSNYMKNFIDATGGYVSRMNEKQMNFAMTANTYNNSTSKFKAMPVSIYCDSLYVPAAQLEMKKLAIMKSKNQLPHQIYALDSRLYSFDEIMPNQKVGINMTKQACETCHADQGANTSRQILPQINVDWFSESYTHDLHSKVSRLNSDDQTAVELKTLIDEVLSDKTLPVPFERRMPYGRRSLDTLSNQCENLIVSQNYQATAKLSYNQIFKCGKDFPQTDPKSLGCVCRKLILNKDQIYKDLYKEQ